MLSDPHPESEYVVTLPAPLALWGRLVSQTAPHSQGAASVCLVLEALAPQVARQRLSAPASGMWARPF